jgi:hypothetical protein
LAGPRRPGARDLRPTRTVLRLERYRNAASRKWIASESAAEHRLITEKEARTLSLDKAGRQHGDLNLRRRRRIPIETVRAIGRTNESARARTDLGSIVAIAVSHHIGESMEIAPSGRPLLKRDARVRDRFGSLVD